MTVPASAPSAPVPPASRLFPTGNATVYVIDTVLMP